MRSLTRSSPAASCHLPWPFATPVAGSFLPACHQRWALPTFFSTPSSTVTYVVATIIFASSATTMFAPWAATRHCCCMMVTKDDVGVTARIILTAAMMPSWRFPGQATKDTIATGYCSTWYGASLGGSKTLKRNILRVFLMSDLINIYGVTKCKRKGLS